jgi:ParB family chromosome partitioning protein
MKTVQKELYNVENIDEVQTKFIDINEIVIKDEVRRNNIKQSKIEELADSINRAGLINPINVVEMDGKYWLVAGYRRYLATKLLDKQQIEARIIKQTD